MRGRNAKDIKEQLRYMAEEYAGKHDPGGRSLIGYTRALENVPDDTRKATDHYLVNYFKPAAPSQSRNARIGNALQIEHLYSDPTPKVTPPPAPPAVANKSALSIFGITPSLPPIF
jgi:hypothetical protein